MFPWIQEFAKHCWKLMRHASKEYNFVSVENLHDFLPSLTGCCSVHNLPFRCNKVGQLQWQDVSVGVPKRTYQQLGNKSNDSMEKEQVNMLFQSCILIGISWILKCNTKCRKDLSTHNFKRADFMEKESINHFSKETRSKLRGKVRD